MTFAQSILVGATAAELFALTQDYGRRLEWDSFLRSAELLGGAAAPAGGVRAYCVSRQGLGMETEYVSFHPPQTTAVNMTRGPWPIARFAGAWHFTEVAPGQTRVRFCYSLRARPGALTRLLGWRFARETRQRLQALKETVLKQASLPRERGE